MKEYIVQINGWNEGFNKVLSTKLLRDTLDLNIREAKSNTDAILDKKELVFLFNTEQKAIGFLNGMEAIGAIVTFKDA